MAYTDVWPPVRLVCSSIRKCGRVTGMVWYGMLWYSTKHTITICILEIYGAGIVAGCPQLPLYRLALAVYQFAGSFPRVWVQPAGVAVVLTQVILRRAYGLIHFMFRN